MNRDPIAEEGGVHLHGFVGNNGINSVDSLGLFAVTDVPGIMTAQGWTKGAAVLSHWFSRSAHTIDEDVFEPSHTEHTIISMSWVLSFTRGQTHYDDIINNKKYVNSSSRQRIWDYIDIVAVPSGSRFGDVFFSSTPFMKNSIISGDNWIYRKEYGNSVLDPDDDLKAALGRWDYVAIVSGTVLSKGTSSACVSLDRVGVFVYDNFDFNGWQPLGFWRTSPPYGGSTPCWGCSWVFNSTFRNYRTTSGMGGDFFIFSSDIKTASVTETRRVP